MAHDAFDVEENIEVAFEIPQSRIPFVFLSKLKFSDQVSKCCSFLGSVRGRSSETGLLTAPTKALSSGHSSCSVA